MNKQIKMQDIVQYTLSDYQFLEDYEVIDTYKSNKNSFVACIKNSEQKVRFVKRKYNQQSLERFKVLHKLYKNGIVLCDSLFILQECDQYYFYVIEAEIQVPNPRFQTLQHYLYYSQINEQERKALLSKVKILLDCLHQQGQYYAGLDTRKIIVDDQKHIYLAPYDLEFQLKNDHFNRAYFSPELLTKISKNQSEISQQMMHKWDIWAFGCIALEILGYCCPFFMSTSLSKQLNLIQKFDVSSHFSNQQQAIRYLLANTLCLDQTERSLLACQRRTASIEIEKVSIKQSSKQLQQINNKQNDLATFRQLNICPSQCEKSNGCELTLNIINIKNVTFQKELKISVHLNKIYHIYLDFDIKNPKKYSIHKKITIKESFKYFQTLLTKPLKIQVKEQNNTSEIYVYLQTLILVKQNKRIWTQPILGTYTAIDGDFSKCKVKINCSLSTPEDSFQSKKIQLNKESKQRINNQNHLLKFQSNKAKIQTQNYKNNENFYQLKTLKDTNQNVKKQKNTSLSKTEHIPSISQIAQQISLITEGFKKKMSLGEAQKQKNIQKKLTTLLKIQSSLQ